LALRGEGGFWFVEEEEAVPGEFVLEEGEEGFAVRAGVETPASVVLEHFWAKFIEFGGSVEEAFGTEEEAVSGSFVEGKAQGLPERLDGSIAFRRVAGEVAVTAFWCETIVVCDSFEEGGFS
jgi:hypothetical protein